MIQLGQNSKQIGVTPAVLLTDPKYARNVSMVRRACSGFGITQVWFTGERLLYDKGKKGKTRLPREERMKGYSEVDLIDGVDLINYDRVFDQFPKGTIPVAVEVLEHAERLHDFVHPKNPLYVFGPEDGNIDPVALRHCHRFVQIPVRHCLNLAMAVGLILYDRQHKQHLAGELISVTPGEYERRGAYDSTLHL